MKFIRLQNGCVNVAHIIRVTANQTQAFQEGKWFVIIEITGDSDGSEVMYESTDSKDEMLARYEEIIMELTS